MNRNPSEIVSALTRLEQAEQLVKQRMKESILKGVLTQCIAANENLSTCF